MSQDQAEATVASAATGAAAAQDAVALLKAEHKKAKELFEQFEKIKESGTPEEKFEIARTVCGDLLIHMAIEEGIFYPAVRKAVDDEEIVNEAEVEHDSAKELIRQLGELKPSDPMFDAKIAVLSEQIEHHVKEEEDEMFPKAKSSGVDLEKLGAEIAAAKREMRVRLGLPAE